MSDTESPLRLAMVGAGAVAEMRYLPAAARLPGIEVTHVVDLDGEHARMVAGEHGVAASGTRLGDVLPHVDAVIVATPPSSHAAIVIECLEAGVHVLCEKPMTINTVEASRMLDAAQSARALLSIAMVRRVGTGIGVLKAFLDRGLLGTVQRIDAEEGGEFSWPLRTGHIFESTDEGGVLRDTGTHIIDLVLWAAQGRGAELVSYQDDSWGGAEANASVSFTFQRSERPVSARVEVSFTRGLRNTVRVYGDAGMLEAPTSGGVDSHFYPDGADIPIRLEPEGVVSGSRTDDFVRQLEAFGAAVRDGGPPPVSAREAHQTIRLIDSCYASRVRAVRPWEAEPSTVGS